MASHCDLTEINSRLQVEDTLHVEVGLELGQQRRVVRHHMAVVHHHVPLRALDDFLELVNEAAVLGGSPSVSWVLVLHVDGAPLVVLGEVLGAATLVPLPDHAHASWVVCRRKHEKRYITMLQSCSGNTHLCRTAREA